MEQLSDKYGHFGASSKRLARRLMTVGESRLELLLLEAVEERARFIRALVLALGLFAFGLLAMMALTAAIVLWLRAYPPEILLSSISVVYGLFATSLLFVLKRSMHERESFSATFDQLRKDHACLENALS
ncbi:MAG TPA: phage holin family protein [Verrucomicrobiales bacterium]|nr:phage holin family protein [Verrucomicrobiales bacterium]